MPRKARKKSETGIYHVMVRGINRADIFHEDEDHEKFLQILKACLLPLPSAPGGDGVRSSYAGDSPGVRSTYPGDSPKSPDGDSGTVPSSI